MARPERHPAGPGGSPRSPSPPGSVAPGQAGWKGEPGYWWQTGSEARFPSLAYNQLWRNHLLAFAMLRQPVPDYQEAFVAVVSHDEDVRCDGAVCAYRENLTAEGDATLLAWKLARMVDAWMGLVPEPWRSEWLEAFRLRYIDLERSAAAWDLWRRGNSA